MDVDDCFVRFDIMSTRGECTMRTRRLIYSLAALSVCIMLAVPYASATGVKKRRPRFSEYGNVLIDNYSTLSNTVAPVVFRHWFHRSRYTCRLCHIDIGFAMSRGDTGITCEDIKNGLFCGTCHNGGEAFAPEESKLLGEPVKNCVRCHSQGEDIKPEHDFREFRKGLPRERLGNGIDWLKAEEKGLIKLNDYIEDVSIMQIKKMKDPKELQISSTESVMPDIIFSHKKHAIWSGCELCHPELFGVKEGATVYSMDDIFNGKYCGACHDIVAFPNTACQRCHTKDVY